MRMLLAAVMMMGGLAPLAAFADDVDGAWSGSYTQQVDGGGAQTIQFVANINQRGHVFSGMTREPNRTGDADEATFAVLSGQEDLDGSISFRKTYATGGWTHSVEYKGHFAGQSRLEGTWHIGESSGSFVMTRN